MSLNDTGTTGWEHTEGGAWRKFYQRSGLIAASVDPGRAIGGLAVPAGPGALAVPAPDTHGWVLDVRGPDGGLLLYATISVRGNAGLGLAFNLCLVTLGHPPLKLYWSGGTKEDPGTVTFARVAPPGSRPLLTSQVRAVLSGRFNGTVVFPEDP